MNAVLLFAAGILVGTAIVATLALIIEFISVHRPKKSFNRSNDEKIDLPDDPIQRAFKIGELLQLLRKEITLHNSKGSVKITTIPPGYLCEIYKHNGIGQAFTLHVPEEELKKVIKGEILDVPGTTYGFLAPYVSFRNVDGNLQVIISGDVYEPDVFERYEFMRLIEDAPKVRYLINELRNIKDSARELIGMLNLIDKLTGWEAILE